MHGADGTRIGDSYRLITTLLDWRRYPAGASWSGSTTSGGCATRRCVTEWG